METAESVARPPSRSSLFDLAVLCLAGFVLRLLLSLGLRLHATNPSAVMAAIACGLGAAASALAILWVFLRIWRRREDWAFYLAAAIFFILLYKLGKYRPEISSIELPLAIFALTPAALLIWAFVRQIRRADELQRRILFEALTVAFVVQFAAAIVYAFLESAGVPRPPSILWASLLVASWSVALAVSARRYE